MYSIDAELRSAEVEYQNKTVDCFVYGNKHERSNEF